MKRHFKGTAIILILLAILSGCAKIGGKTANLSVAYAVCTIISLLIVAGYCIFAKKREPWFILLFSSVLVVNAGYLALSVSKTVEEALLANRIAYLGSVFLPLFMLMIIMNVSKIAHKKWLTAALIALGAVVLVIAGSPGYLDIYYKEVTLEVVNGMTVLNKVYGPWHGIYLIYLLGYFGAIIAMTVRAALKNKLYSTEQTIILIVAVFVNIGVWLIEQFVKIDFEVLSISYIISELFLLGFNIIATENERLKEAFADAKSQITKENVDAQQIDITVFEGYIHGLSELTATENTIFELYTNGKNTSEVLTALNIKENTLKFHNKNIYSKLGVSSRRELIEIYKQLKKADAI